jgi:large subunit ribosomal protein L25|tara:strand:- start:121 stop:741 length:621 start_codon:yes stop_codon:yes gene_type:complete
MKSLKLSVRNRKRSGRNHANRLRRAGEIPAIIYGKSGSHAFATNQVEFLSVYKQASGSAALIEINDDENNSHLAILKEVQRNSLSGQMIHIDFQEVSRDQEFNALIPVSIEGISFGVKNEGGVLDTQSHEIEVNCLAQNLPEQINVDVTDLKLGESILVKNIPAIDGVRFTDPDATVVVCTGTSAGASSAGDDEEDEPENSVAAAG